MTTLAPSTDLAADRALIALHEVWLAQRRLINFTQYTKRDYRADRAHEVIAAALDRVVEGECKRLMILAPPQHGKSELASVRLPAFWLLRRPNDPVIMCSYGADLAQAMSRQARGILEGPEWQVLSPVRLSPRSQAVGFWTLQRPHRGSVLAQGVGGAITGHGGLLGLIDDPYSGWAEAYSEATRATVLEWYKATFRPRIWEDGAIVIINTRWHEADLCGVLLKEEPDKWEVLRLPAVGETQEERDKRNATCGLAAGLPDPVGRESGEPLCPTRFSAAALAEIRQDVGAAPWESEYMGTPTSPEGNLFKPHWWRYWDAFPEGLQEVIISVDCAFTGEATSDFVVLQVWGRKWADCFLLDQVRERMDAVETARAVVSLSGRWPKATYKLVEKSANGPAVISMLQHRIPGLVAVIPKAGGGSSDNSKRGRAQAVLHLIEAGNVYLPLPERHPWVPDFIAECSGFPNAAHDDQVDAMTQALNHLLYEQEDAPPPPDERPVDRTVESVVEMALLAQGRLPDAEEEWDEEEFE